MIPSHSPDSSPENMGSRFSVFPCARTYSPLLSPYQASLTSTLHSVCVKKFQDAACSQISRIECLDRQVPCALLCRVVNKEAVCMRHSSLIQASPDNTRSIDVMSLKHVVFWGCAASTAYLCGWARLSEPLQALAVWPGRARQPSELAGALPTQIASTARARRVVFRRFETWLWFPLQASSPSLRFARSPPWTPLGQKWILLVQRVKREQVSQRSGGRRLGVLGWLFPKAKWEPADQALELSPGIRFGVTE
jgi:hypothetical protein